LDDTCHSQSLQVSQTLATTIRPLSSQVEVLRVHAVYPKSYCFSVKASLPALKSVQETKPDTAHLLTNSEVCCQAFADKEPVEIAKDLTISDITFTSAEACSHIVDLGYERSRQARLTSQRAIVRSNGRMRSWARRAVAHSRAGRIAHPLESDAGGTPIRPVPGHRSRTIHIFHTAWHTHLVRASLWPLPLAVLEPLAP
jgi:hypothetical protein